MVDIYQVVDLLDVGDIVLGTFLHLEDICRCLDSDRKDICLKVFYLSSLLHCCSLDIAPRHWVGNVRRPEGICRRPEDICRHLEGIYHRLRGVDVHHLGICPVYLPLDADPILHLRRPLFIDKKQSLYNM